MKDNLNVEVEVKKSNLPQLDKRLESLKQKLSERSDEILDVINSIDNDPNFQTIQVDDMKFNLFDESGTGEPTIFQLIRWNNLINRLNDTYFGKDDIIDERWDSEWYDYVGDNFSNYDSESFCFMRDDWKYELEESQERRMISEWINL